MKTLPIKIDLTDLKLTEEEKLLSPQIHFFNLVENVLSRQGDDKAKRRTIYKMFDAIEAAAKAGAESVELEDEWWGILKHAFEGKMLSTKFMRRVDELLDQVKDR